MLAQRISASTRALRSSMLSRPLQPPRQAWPLAAASSVPSHSDCCARIRINPSMTPRLACLTAVLLGSQRSSFSTQGKGKPPLKRARPSDPVRPSSASPLAQQHTPITQPLQHATPPLDDATLWSSPPLTSDKMFGALAAGAAGYLLYLQTAFGPWVDALPSSVTWLVGVNGLVYAARYVLPAPAVYRNLLVSAHVLARGRVHTLLTHTVSHGRLMHLVSSVAFIAAMGPTLAHALGDAQLIGLYVAAGVLGGAGQALYQYQSTSGLTPAAAALERSRPAEGASGSVQGLIGALCALDPWWTPGQIAYFPPIIVLFAVQLAFDAALVLGRNNVALTRVLSQGGKKNYGSITHMLGALVGVLVGLTYRLTTQDKSESNANAGTSKATGSEQEKQRYIVMPRSHAVGAAPAPATPASPAAAPK
jgi:membrane associated rhomboid family serine protease